jgi:hypothetical protein
MSVSKAFLIYAIIIGFALIGRYYNEMYWLQ